MLLVRRRAPEGSYFTDGDRASGVFGVLAGGFAIFAGFIIFLAFTTYDQSRSRRRGRGAHGGRSSSRRRSSCRPRCASAWTGSSSATDARSCTRSGRRWRTGEGRRDDQPLGGRAVPEPAGSRTRGPPTEEAAYGKWLDQTSDREEGRRDRLHGAEGIIPGSIWLVLLLIAGVVFAFMLFFADSGGAGALPGDADGLGDHGDRADAAGDRRARQPVPATAWGGSSRSRWSGRCGSWTRARAVAGRDGAAALRRPRRSGLVLMEDAGADPPSAASSSRRPCCSRWRRWRPPGRPTSRRAGTASRRGPRARRSPPASSRRARRTWRIAQAQIDVALFTQWVDAYARDETELGRFYRKRFRAEFQPAFGVGGDEAANEPRRAAVAVRDAAVQARGQREGRPARGAGRRGLPARRGASSSARTTTRSPSCCSPRRCSSPASAPGCTSPTPRMVVLGLGYALFLGTVIWIATFPVSVSV